MRDVKCDIYALKNSVIGAREYWMIHKGDSTKYHVYASKKVYLDYNQAKKDTIELCFKYPNEKFYILKCMEVYTLSKNGIIAEEIKKIK